jgi:hypothetical protein
MPSGGCVEKDPWEKIEGIIDEACPVVYLQEYYQVFKTFQYYSEKSLFPYEGGYLQQPYLIMEYLNLIEAIVDGKRN